MNQIGTLSERSVHRVIKNYIEPDKQYQEIKVGSYIADIKRDNQIIEIQTQNFKKLVNKVEYYISNAYNIRVVYPVIKERYINWIDPVSHEVVERRKSSAKGSIQDVLNELYWLKEYIGNSKFTMSLILISAEEYKLIDGYGRNNKKRATKIDKVPTRIIEEIKIESVSDLKKLIPKTLKKEFTSKEFVKESRSRKKWAGSYVKILRELGIIHIVRKEGNTYIYSITESNK